MASIRKLKKQVNYLSYELLTEAFAYKHFHPELEEKKFDEIIKKIVKGRNDLITRINSSDEINGEENLHSYFNAVRRDMAEMMKVLDSLQ